MSAEATSADFGARSATVAAGEAGSALASTGTVSKLVIAIHGIGDQFRHATIRSVVTRFGRYFDFPAAVPLGSFYSADGLINAFRLQAPPEVPAGLGNIGFAEVYWADIPRAIQKEGYTIEEAKAWARTIVDRVRARYGHEIGEEFKFDSQDYRDAASVLQEMIETIRILGNLLYLAEKAGLPKFDLDELLTSYLGDVQIVADFATYRQKILQQFRQVLDALWDRLRDQSPDIYIVAHSEGTVVAFMALLQAMSLPTPGEVPPPPRPEWIDHVRGFMTIGSPIDKHLILWPEIWRQFRTPGPPVKPPIRWRNYYDYGDPVGFDLDTTRTWMNEPEHHWAPAFEFRPEDDFGFSRYALPGAAHNEYWGDGGVFGHFIETVVGVPPAAGRSFAERPPNRWWARVVSYVVPYVLAFLLAYTGVYLLVKALHTYVTPEPAGNAPAETNATVGIVPGSPQGDAYLVQWWHARKGARQP